MTTAPTVRAVGTALTNASAVQAYVVSVPTHSSGDILVCAVCLNGAASENMPAPSGWTRKWSTSTDGGSQGATNSTTYESLYIFWRRSDGSEGATVTFTADVAATGSAIMVSVQNAVASGDPFDGAAGREDASNAAHSINVVTTDSNELLYSAIAEDSASTVITGPTGWTTTQTTAGQRLGVSYLDNKAAGTWTADWSLAAAKNAGVWVAGIKGISGGGGGSGTAAGSYVYTGASVGENGDPTPASQVLLIIGDTQFDDGSGTRTKATDCMNMVRATTHDHVWHTGDVCNNWTSSQITDADNIFKVGNPPQPWTEMRFALGNHEYDYNWPTGYDWEPSTGKGPSNTVTYYSEDLEIGWHLVVLDLAPGGASVASGSAQYNWLDADLSANEDKPTLILGHWGRYSSSSAHGSNTDMAAMWAMMMSHGNVEALISGHQHHPERFRRMDNAGQVDTVDGIMQFTCPPTGQVTTLTSTDPTTGGLAFVDNSQKVGILRLTLYNDHWTWDFMTPPGYPYTLDGSGSLTGLGAPDSGTQANKVELPDVIGQVTNLHVTSYSQTEIDLAWDVVPEALFYEIERDGSLVGTSYTNSYQDSGRTQNTQYSYRVRAGG